MTRDLKNNIAIVQLLAPQVINNTDTKSSLLDTRGFESAIMIVNLGDFTGVDADSTFTPILQESDTTVDGDFTSVAAADIEGAFTLVDATNEDSVVQSVGYKGTKRYIRVLLDFVTGTGGITSAPVSVTGLLGHASYRPVTAPAAVSAT
jgi:hypothetical protein